MGEDFLGLETLLVHGDQDAERALALAPAIEPSSTFRARDAEEFAALANAVRPERYYARYGNPTQRRCERLIASLEWAESCLLLASGMAAISTTVLAFLSAGDHVVAQNTHYMGTLRLLQGVLPRWGVEVSLVDQADPDAFEAALRPNTKLILLETPSNPLLGITDLGRVAAAARRAGVISIADNTFASPCNQTPLALGVDLVVHSATKYLGGHSDLVAGAVCGSKALVDTVWEHAIVLGGNSNAFDSFLLLRGLRTLGLRVERQNRSALALAEWLQEQPAVARVHYPGLPGHPGHAIAASQMKGFGGVLSIELAGGYAAGKQLVAGLRLAANAVSLGGVETLAIHAASVWEGSLTPAQIEAAGVPAGLVRIAVGLEDVADLKRDFAAAFGDIS